MSIVLIIHRHIAWVVFMETDDTLWCGKDLNLLCIMLYKQYEETFLRNFLEILKHFDYISPKYS